jgi:hypothetical protein
MDWNWYFAALAQSAAAIIGIFAAFIFTKIINNQGMFSQKKRALTALINESFRIQDLAKGINCDWYLKEIREDELETLDIHYNIDYVGLTPKECYDKLNFSPYDSADEIIELIRQEIEKRVQKVREAKEEREAKVEREALLERTHVPQTFSQLLKQPIKVTPIIEPIEQLRFTSAEAISNVKRQLENARMAAADQIRKIGSFIIENKCNPESSLMINWVILGLLLLFYTTVIYPLSFLPVPNNMTISLEAFWPILFSMKGLLLTILAIAFTAIIVAFMVINHKMKYPINEMKVLLAFREFDQYSKYLDNYYKNTQE